MKDLIISPYLKDAMVIQRDASFPVWSSKKVTVTFLGKTYESKETDGKWLVTLDPQKAGGPFTMEIAFDDDSVSIKDIYCGDVWLCSGQSNMEMMMQRLRDDYSEEWDLITAKKDLPVRQFKVPQNYDFLNAQDNLQDGYWQKPSKETLHEFSAVAWFFANYLYEKYKIPVGLVNTAWGGTPVQSWMSEEALSLFPEKIAEGKKYADPKKREEIASIAGKAVQKWETSLKEKDLGLKEQWQNIKTDISKWGNINLPGNFTKEDLFNFCGVIWLAKDFEAKKNFIDAKVWLGTIVDADTVFINGVEIGNTTYRYPPRKYIPAGLIKHGKNRIVIRVTCNSGEGGVTCGKPFRIFSKAGDGGADLNSENETIELSGTWKYQIGAAAERRPDDFYFQRQPMGNFNSMIAPVLKFPLKGVIWYQGESNDSYPFDYEKLFPLMINDWRLKNNCSALPFLFVQLPIWKAPSDNNENSSWAIIREAQRKAMSVPFTGMAAALELGEWNDLHPLNKKDVAYRLFLAAEKTVFGVINTSPGPVIKDWKIDNNKILINFDNCGDGLCVFSEVEAVTVSTNAFLRTLELETPEHFKDVSSAAYVSALCDDKYIRLPAEIEGKDIISIDISSIKNKKINKILYAWADNPRDRQLFNSDGLPVIPFKIEIKQGENDV